ncbi:MAG: hypothetical protein B1H08_05540, partial [Candidatus Omnitrophica bacterium 4484_171]
RQYLLKRIASGFLLRPFKRTKPYYNTLSKRLFRLPRVLKYLAIFYTKHKFYKRIRNLLLYPLLM